MQESNWLVSRFPLMSIDTFCPVWWSTPEDDLRCPRSLYLVARKYASIFTRRALNGKFSYDWRESWWPFTYSGRNGRRSSRYNVAIKDIKSASSGIFLMRRPGNAFFAMREMAAWLSVIQQREHRCRRHHILAITVIRSREDAYPASLLLVEDSVETKPSTGPEQRKSTYFLEARTQPYVPLFSSSPPSDAMKSLALELKARYTCTLDACCWRSASNRRCVVGNLRPDIVVDRSKWGWRRFRGVAGWRRLRKKWGMFPKWNISKIRWSNTQHETSSICWRHHRLQRYLFDMRKSWCVSKDINLFQIF